VLLAAEGGSDSSGAAAEAGPLARVLEEPDRNPNTSLGRERTSCRGVKGLRGAESRSEATAVGE
jgi:hypothetical protein